MPEPAKITEDDVRAMRTELTKLEADQRESKGQVHKLEDGLRVLRAARQTRRSLIVELRKRVAAAKQLGLDPKE